MLFTFLIFFSNVLFQFHDLLLTNEDMYSLVTKDHWIEANVISVYAALLNLKELLRADSSPKKAFFVLDAIVSSFAFNFYTFFQQ